MHAILDLTPPTLDIKFKKGSTLDPIFYCLTKDKAPIDLTGYKARAMAKITPDSPCVTGFNLTTENGGLIIETGEAVLGTQSIMTYGIRLNVPAEITSNFDFDKAIFNIELEAPSGRVTPFLDGKLIAQKEIVK